jgi:hypothetical protein
MREIPLSVYLQWPTPNYENPTTRGDALLTINIVFIILVTLSLGIRLYSRMLVKHLHNRHDSRRLTGEPKLWLEQTHVGCGIHHDSKRKHHRLRREDHVHACVKLYTTIIDLPLLSACKRHEFPMVCMDAAYQSGSQSLHLDLFHPHGGIHLHVSLAHNLRLSDTLD